jgi:hypothetical protein
MAMARVAAGSFDIKDNKLEFCATEKPDEVSSIFEREVESLNELAEEMEWTFVSVSANQTTVFVGVNFTFPFSGDVFEIDAKKPDKFKCTLDEIYNKSHGQKYYNIFGDNIRVQMICCSGTDQAAVLILDDKKVGSVWFRDKPLWKKIPVDYNTREQDIARIACGAAHCAALTSAGDVFTCTFPRSSGMPKWTIYGGSGFDGGGPQRALQKLVDHMDAEVGYKRCCDPMAASFGVTGGLRNPYLLNINTDGEVLDKLIEKHNNETKARTAENRKALEDRVKREVEMKAQRENEVQRIKALEEEIEYHENEGKQHKTNLEEAAKKMQEAKRLHDEAHSVHSEHDTKLRSLKKKLQNEETVMGIKSVSTLSTNPHDSPEVDNRSTGNSKSKKSLKQKVSNLFWGEKASAENELHFEDIARFSASREHRCTYI